MDDDRTTNGDEAANNEPGLTDRNSRTVVGEEQLADESSDVEANVERSDQIGSRSGGGAMPHAYGEGGGTTPETDE